MGLMDVFKKSDYKQVREACSKYASTIVMQDAFNALSDQDVKDILEAAQKDKEYLSQCDKGEAEFELSRYGEHVTPLAHKIQNPPTHTTADIA